jgi:glycogen(starch) synthase
VRVLFVSPFYPPYSIGGAEHSTFVLAEALVARGHDVKVVAPRLGAESASGVVHVETVETGLRARGPGAPIGPRAFDRPDVQARFAARIARLVASADVVHCQTVHLLPAAFAAARRARVPIVATIRDLGGVCSVNVCLLDRDRVPSDCGYAKLARTCIPRFASLYDVRSRWTLWPSAVLGYASARARSWLLRRCDATFSVSGELAALYADAGLVDRSRVNVLHNIADLPKANGSGETGYALYVGRISPGKGGDELLAAVARVREQIPEFTLVVAGHADRRWRTRLETADGIDYRGWIARSALGSLYAGARLAVVPSIWPEPLPRAALESASAGVPVVATRVGGIPEVVVDGTTGLLVEPRDPSALAAAIVRLWHEPELARRLGAAARDRAATEFGPDRIARRAEELYQRVVVARREGR